jgi:aspartate aminotransferase
MQLAKRLDRVSEPQTIKMAKLSRELKAKGIDIVDLSLGEPDFNTPEHICHAATEAMQQGYTKYTPVAGTLDLRKAVCVKLLRDNGLEYTPEQIFVSTGAKQSLANVIMCITNAGDEAIIPAPYWVTYASVVSLAEGKPVILPSSVESNFKISPEQLEAAITDKTRLFVFSSPCNPSGSIYSKEELKALVDVLALHENITVISDEIYEYINYVGPHESIAQFESIKERVVVVNGFSKGYAMTGWRLGYIATKSSELIKAVDKYQSQYTSGANSIAQRAAIEALTGDMNPTKRMVEAFAERRAYVVKALSEIDGIKVNQPEGAFYAFPDISSFIGKSDGEVTIQSDEDLAMYILHKGHVTVVNGAAFGSPQNIRISFATSMDQLIEACKRLKQVLGQLK